MTRLRPTVLLAGMALAVAACAGVPARDNCLRLFGSPSFCLQPTSAVRPFTALQRIEVNHDGMTEVLIVQLEVDDKGMRLAGLTPFGQKVVRVSYDNERVTAETAVALDRRLDPRQLAALVQLAWWPLPALQQGLPEANVRMTETEESWRQRRLMQDDRNILTFTYIKPRTVDIERATADWRIAIDTLEWSEE